MKIYWKVGAVPTGHYRTFEKRSWPGGYYDKTNDNYPAAYISCDKEYSPRNIKEGNHPELTVRIADYSEPSNKETKCGFTWRTLKHRCKTLKEAKELTTEFIKTHPDIISKEIL